MSRYEELGVSIKKKGIESFKSVITNLYPEAFCVIQQDPDYQDMGIVTHTDSAGSKPILSYINYKESGNADWFSGLAQDALAMNINDLVCVGAKPVSFVDYIAFNTLLIERVKLLKALSSGFGYCLDTLQNENTPVLFAGGETADLPDLLRTLDVCVTIFGRMPLDQVISGKQIKPGDLILGVRSGGKIRYEKGINSGIMSNGHTLARSCLINASYVKKYPEISHSARGRYTGRYNHDDHIDVLDTTVGEALLHPTRLFSPIASKVLSKLGSDVHGMVHNTGGGQTKCLRLGKGLFYIKNNLPIPDPMFGFIKRESGVEWREMYKVFNMGVGFELIVDPDLAEDALSIIEGFNVGVSVIGRCEEAKGDNLLVIDSSYGKFEYN
ncbi:AIR synthase related protein [Thermoproteota archaeon]